MLKVLFICHGNSDYSKCQNWEARGDRVEVILTRQEEESMGPELLYEEEVLVRDEYAGKPGLPDRLKIVNRYMYTANDTLVLKNYRIAC